MYSSLLKEAQLGKIYSEKLESNINSFLENGSQVYKGYPMLQNVQNTCTKKMSEGRQSSQEEKYPEISMRTFFDFMRTAYQVNDSFELNSVLNENSGIDWNALAKTNLDLYTKASSSEISNCKINDKSIETDETKNPETDSSFNVEKIRSSCSSRRISQKCQSRDTETESLPSISQTNPVQSKISIETKEQREKEEKKGKTEEYKKKKSSFGTPEIKEHVLATAMKKKLSDVLHEGLLDSVLPYMVPKPAFSQPIIKKPLANPNIKKSLSTSNVEYKSSISILKEKDKDKSKQQKNAYETEVEIHVCDEAKNIKKDFRCPQKLLIKKMCYFAEVTAGQKLEEMDISVHCDIVIFDWLMRWVKKDLIKKSEWPVLEPTNVIPIMVSASFLQMEPLLESCLTYCYNNMSDVLKTLTIMSCLNDTLLTRLANLFSNMEVEMIKDKKDKIQSRLFCKLIMSLAEPTPDNKRGHFSSLATLFKCGKCGKNIVSSISDSVPCIPSAMRLDSKGNLHSKHTRDFAWNLNEYIITLRTELRSWRKVYWRLWGDCHFLSCHQCGNYFPVNQMDWCSYHPEVPQFFVLEQQRATPFPLGRWPCCSQRAYRFEALPNKEGCRFREHSPVFASEQDEGISNILAAYRDIIVIEPPQLFFPEKITRLAARDSSIPPGKLACKETMWWEGIELVPPRPKLGLLGKIWGGSGLRKPCAPSQKVHQASQATDVSSAASSETDSDEENFASGCRYSSFDEDSLSSEESNVWPPLKPGGQKFKGGHPMKRSDGGGSWSANLIVRYNQDNQRDFEEKAAAQMVALLTKRISFQYGLLSKSYPHGKMHGYYWNNNTPIGGTYVKLEAEFREQLKSKNTSQTKGATKTKSAKIN